MAAAATVIEQAVRALGASRGEGQRHPLVPAALRVERSRLRSRRGETSEQTALTLWFGEGPGLPGPSGTGRTVRLVARVVVVVAGAAAIGAMGAIAGQREAERLSATADRSRLTG
jgi:hypothetical protein